MVSLAMISVWFWRTRESSFLQNTSSNLIYIAFLAEVIAVSYAIFTIVLINFDTFNVKNFLLSLYTSYTR